MSSPRTSAPPVGEVQAQPARTQEWYAAERRLAERRHKGFRVYLVILTAANALVVVFWVVLALAGQLDVVKVSVLPGRPPLPSGFFWPIFPIAVCAVLVLLSARRTYRRDGCSAEDIEREMARTRSAAPAAKGN